MDAVEAQNSHPSRHTEIAKPFDTDRQRSRQRSQVHRHLSTNKAFVSQRFSNRSYTSTQEYPCHPPSMWNYSVLPAIRHVARQPRLEQQSVAIASRENFGPTLTSGGISTLSLGERIARIERVHVQFSEGWDDIGETRLTTAQSHWREIDDALLRMLEYTRIIGEYPTAKNDQSENETQQLHPLQSRTFYTGLCNELIIYSTRYRRLTQQFQIRVLFLFD